MPDQKLIVPPFSKEEIVEIIKEAIKTGTIASETQVVEDDKSYTLKLVNGDVVLVEDQD